MTTFSDHAETAGKLAAILAPIAAVVVWAWKKIIGPRMAAAMAASIRESFADQNVVIALREALTKENVLMTEQLRTDFRVRAAQLDRVDAQVQDHDRTLDRLAPLPDVCERLERTTEEQTKMLQQIGKGVEFLRGRVENGQRTFRPDEEM